MSDNDLYVSNGTCYFARGQIADRHFIPCGNAVVNGPQACCYEGDFCLSSNTCWDDTTIVTYVAGCTDPSFTSSKCIQKNDYPDQQWVAMARCDAPNIDIWSGCAKHPNVTAIEKEDCDCTASDPLIRSPNGKTSFDNIASLPQTIMGSISFNPTALPTRGAGSASSRLSGTASVSSSVSGPASTGSSGSSGLNDDAKVGIGVGVGVGGTILLTVIAFLMYKLRHQKKAATPSQHETQQQQQQEEEEPGSQAVSPDTGDPSRAQQLSPEPASIRTNTKSPEGGVRTWDKPELPGESILRSELPPHEAPKDEHLSELPGGA
ncbi:hypothetical protein PG990_004970 [Apiospora arundinis]|uniref:Uncharacterized protein n=1 Tax=Apiospora arundinis TaxID=335852 RepID=A0ABR2J659_9PEZI